MGSSSLFKKKMHDGCGLTKLIPAMGLQTFGAYHYYPAKDSTSQLVQYPMFALDEKLRSNSSLHAAPCWAEVVTHSMQEMAQVLHPYPTHSPVAPPDEGSLIQGAGDRQVYLFREGSLHGIPDIKTFLAMGFDFGNVKHVTGAELAKFQFGDPVPSK